MRQTILITGGSGFLGRVFIETLGEHYDIQTLSRRSADYKVDLRSEKFSPRRKFDIVVHAAGKAHVVPKTKAEARDFYDVNVTGTRNLLDSLKPEPPSAFVYISSVAVYGATRGFSIPENAPLAATDPYGISKIQAEQLVQEWCVLNNVTATILRLPLIIGPEPAGNLASMINGIRRNYYFNIAGGTARKSMVLASDVARVVPKAAEVGGIYNLTDGYHPNFSELSHCIASQLNKTRVLNLPAALAVAAAKFGDILGKRFPLNTDKYSKMTSDLTFDDLKARQLLGWNPTEVLKGYKIFE